MTSLLLGLLVVVGVAVSVIVVVALPHLREGSPVLTPEAERLAEQARRTVGRAAEAAGSTAGALRDRIIPDAPPRDAVDPVATESGPVLRHPVDRPAVPPRQVASPAATPPPGNPRVAEPLAVDPGVRRS